MTTYEIKLERERKRYWDKKGQPVPEIRRGNLDSPDGPTLEERRERKRAKQRESRANVKAGKRPSGLLNRYLQHGYKGYVCPAWAVRELVETHQRALQAEYEACDFLYTRLSQHDRNLGWRSLLIERLSLVLGITVDGVERRLRAALTAEQRIVNAEFVEAICIVLNIDLDRDTNVPVLPGCVSQAKTMLAERAEFFGKPYKNDLDLHKDARRASRLVSLMLYYPHNTERLRDLAPWDFTRGYA